MQASDTLERVIPGQVFKTEVLTWAKRIGVEPREIRLRLMKNKWASCSSNGRLTFNTEILQQPADARAEAIVHELLHLKLPNHGKLFKVLMGAYLQDIERGESRNRRRKPAEGIGRFPERFGHRDATVEVLGWREPL